MSQILSEGLTAALSTADMLLLTPAGGHLEAHSITLPGDLWRRIEQLGGGNRSAGVRRLAEGALEEQEAWTGQSGRSPSHQTTN